MREIKKINIQKEFRAHKNGLKEINGRLTVSMRSVLKYFFNHSESLYICQKGSGPNRKEMLLEKCFIWKDKDIYSTIVKTVYRNSSIEQHILENLQIDESEIETLYADYKH